MCNSLESLTMSKLGLLPLFSVNLKVLLSINSISILLGNCTFLTTSCIKWFKVNNMAFPGFNTNAFLFLSNNV